MNKPTKEEFMFWYPYHRKSSLDELNINIFKGSELHSTHGGPGNGYPTYWAYPETPENIEKSIQPNKKYKVWYTTRYSADPYDSTEFNVIYYIEEV